jgi:putative Holliday junction resolvase
VLALDLGEARIGLAISDGLGITAQPLPVLRRTALAADLEALARIVAEREVQEIVIGLPLLLSGVEGTAAQAARAFAAALAERLPGVPLELWDERLTSAEAERVLVSADVSRRRRREVLDGLAATLLLQSYLDAAGART